MRRIYTFLTIDPSNGEPTVAGAYFDVRLSDLDVDMSENVIVQRLRTGRSVVIHDSAIHLPNTATLILGRTMVDIQSGAVYDSAYRYLGNALFYEYVNHNRIAIFQQSENGEAQRCYVAMMTKFDRALASHATSFHADKTYLTRREMPRKLSFELVVSLDGYFTDIEDITSATWTAR